MKYYAHQAKRILAGAYCVLFAAFVFPVSAEEAAPKPPSLPEPLTLEFALSLVDEAHPKLQLSESAIREAQAEQREASAQDDLRVWLEARLRYGRPVIPSNGHDWEDDHSAGVFLDKILSDFGRTESKTKAAAELFESQQYLYQDTRQQRRVEIMQRYFDVLLADLDYARYNEDMAAAFVSLDKLRDKHELGQVSELEVLKKNAEYQQIRTLRFKSQNLQRISRARLAYALNRPGQLPDILARPENLPQLSRVLPELEVLQAQALEYNNVILALRAKITAAQSRLAAARAEVRPVLRGGAEANAYSKDRASYDNWRINLTLEVPLSTGDRVDASVAKQQALLYRLQAELSDAEEQIKQQVLELWLGLENLRIQREQMQAQTDYRELYLDRSRALYELEVKTDLGDAMARITEAELDALRTDFNMVLAWEHMDALTGGLQLNPAKGAIAPGPKNLTGK